jgi:sterol desaturase/sphingolipid hydroxylase (fatty acid hydroxylase superfamily)
MAPHGKSRSLALAAFLSVVILTTAVVVVAWAPHLVGRFAAMVGRRLVSIATTLASRESLTSVLGVSAVVAAEIGVLGYSKSSLYRLLHPSKSTYNDMFWYVARLSGLVALFAALGSLGLTVALSSLTSRYLTFGLLERIHSQPLRVFLFLVSTDFLNYWVHRGRHCGWWWEFHKLHHSATEFNVLTWARGHPLDDATIFVVSVVPLAVLGGSPGDSLIVMTLLAMHAGLSHSMLPWRWGWFGKYVLQPPVGHRIHHSPLPEHRDKNFASIFPIWDVLFGTAYTGDVVNDEVGVDDNAHNVRGVVFDVVQSLKKAVERVRGRPPRAEPVLAREALVSEVPRGRAAAAEHEDDSRRQPCSLI